MIVNNYTLKRPKNVEENIYALIKLKKKSNIQSALLYDDYNSLFQVFLKFNPQKVDFTLFRQYYWEKLFCQRSRPII